MGSPKPLLVAGGQSFVRGLITTLKGGGVDRVVVVVRPGAVAVSAEVASGGGEVVVNPDPDRGQLSSLLAGLDAVDRPGVDAILVTLVDVPLVGSSSVAALLARAAVSRAPILRAACRGAHGHPVIFTRGVFAALRAADPATGAKPVMRAFAVEDVEVDDPGILRDVDTPEDYERLLT
jgi:CTP:molybdopterin cytidylyltransferase MocA